MTRLFRRAGMGLLTWLALCGLRGVSPTWAECPLVYLPVQASFSSSYDDTPDWAPPKDSMAPFDGNFQTRWATRAGQDGESIYVDFGTPKTLSKLVISWERAYAVDYEIQVFDTAQQWRTLATLHDQDGGKDEITVPETVTRYVKLIGLKRAHPDWGFSIWEMELYGCQAANPQDRPIEAVFPDRRRPEEAVPLVMEEPLPSPGPVDPSAFQNGMVYLSFHENQLATPESDRMLEELATRLHVTDIALVVTWYQDTPDSTALYPESPKGGRTPVDESLSHAINKMHALGMRVMLKPHVDVQSGEYRGEIAASEAWFDSYRTFVRHYAELAAKYHVEMFCLGTELAGTSYAKWEQAWRRVIQEIRAVYPGPLVYGANWDEYKSVPFWNALDFIGIDAYFPLTNSNDPTKEELLAAWQRWADEIGQWRQERQLTQPVIFTEIGYGSADGVNRTPWTIASKTEDQPEQTDCLEALLRVMTQRAWFKGMYWWNWFSQAVDSPLGYPIRGKLAEGVLARWYLRSSPQPQADPPEQGSRAPSTRGVGVTVRAAVNALRELASPDATAAHTPAAKAAAPAAPASPVAPAAPKLLFGFESGPQGWAIPDWALEKPDFVATKVVVGPTGATEGRQALEVAVDFPGGQWNGALAEVEEYFDWTPYRTLTVDVTLPAEAPAGLKAKLVLTVGEKWEWTEMRRALQLTPGQTTTITASLAPGSEDWKRTVVEEGFRKDVRKLAVRVESNRPAYKGTVSIDNIRLE